MDLDYYRNFITIIENGSLNAAAKKMHIAQPALSHQLKLLETKYGCRLLKLSRGMRKLQMTEEGRVFLEKAKTLISLEEAARMEIQNITLGIAVTLRISIAPAKAPNFIKNVLIPFNEKYPDICYQLHEASIQEQIEQINSGISDFAITNATLPDETNFRVIQKDRECFQIVATRDNPWITPADSYSLDDIKNAPLCLNYVCSQTIRRCCEKTGFTPKISSLSTTRSAAMQFASHRLGIAIVTQEASETLPDNLFAIPLIGKELYIEKTLFVAKDKPLSLLTKTFIDFYLQRTKSANKKGSSK